MGRKNKCAKKLAQRSKKLAGDSTKANKTNAINKQAAIEAKPQIQDTAVEINTANQLEDKAVEINTPSQDKAVETNNTQKQDLGDEVTEDPTVNVPAAKKTVLEIATEASKADFDPSHRIFFTYGASVPEKKTRLTLGQGPNNNQELKRLAGAAAIYKQPSANNTKGSWCGKQWTLGHCETTSEADAELVAISECLSIAAKELRHQKTAPKITIFTHDQDATNKFGRVCYIDPTKGLPEATPALLEIVNKTHSLRQRVGAVIELICVPQHAVELRLCCNSRPATVKGTKLAEFAARKATIPKNIKVPSKSH